MTRYQQKTKAHGKLTLMQSYLKNCKQKVVLNNSTTLTQTIIAGVPQDSTYFSMYL